MHVSFAVETSPPVERFQRKYIYFWNAINSGLSGEFPMGTFPQWNIQARPGRFSNHFPENVSKELQSVLPNDNHD